VSRIVLGARSPLEVALGLAIGLVALAVFAWAYLRRAPPEPSLEPLWYALLLIAALHGSELHPEMMLRALSLYLDHRNKRRRVEPTIPSRPAV
jgi:hypothetical protein